MSKPIAVHPDPELIAVTILEQSSLIIPPVGVALPADWKPTPTAAYLQVAWDGTPTQEWPLAHHSIRVVAWAGSTTNAKALALLAQGVLLGYTGGLCVSIKPGIGPIPATDPDNGGALAAVTVRLTTRAALIS